MRAKAAVFWAVVILSFAVTVFVVHADEFPRPTVGYSADQHLRMEMGGRTFEMDGHICSAIDKERKEMQFAGHTGIHIVRRDKGVSWMLMPQNKSYREHVMGESMGNVGKRAPDWTRGADVKLKKVGTEEVGGYETTKYRVTAKDKDSSTGEGFAWLTKQNIPVKLEGTFGVEGKTAKFWIEEKNIKIGKQDPSLFEIPPGYTKFEMPAFSSMPPQGAANMPGASGTPADMQKIREQMMKRMQERKEGSQAP